MEMNNSGVGWGEPSSIGQVLISHLRGIDSCPMRAFCFPLIQLRSTIFVTLSLSFPLSVTAHRPNKLSVIRHSDHLWPSYILPPPSSRSDSICPSSTVVRKKKGEEEKQRKHLKNKIRKRKTLYKLRVRLQLLKDQQPSAGDLIDIYLFFFFHYYFRVDAQIKHPPSFSFLQMTPSSSTHFLSVVA